MGMAASQARYLALTARKTNTEYEGQQINQARTALANQSANLFNRLLDLEVPVAPKTTDYTELQYSYTDGENESVLEEWTQLSSPNPDSNYLVKHYYYTNKYTGAMRQLNDPQVQLNSGNVTTTNIGLQQAIDQMTKSQNDLDKATQDKQAVVNTSRNLANYSNNVSIYSARAISGGYEILDGSGNIVATYLNYTSQNIGTDQKSSADAIFNKLKEMDAMPEEINKDNDVFVNNNGEIALRKDLETLYGISTISENFTLPVFNKDIVEAKSSSYQTEIRLAEMSETTAKIQYDTAINYYNDLIIPTHVGNCELKFLDPTNDDHLTQIRQIVSDMKDQNIKAGIIDCIDDSGNYTGGIFSFTMNGKEYFTTYEELLSSYDSHTGPNDIDGQIQLPYYNATYVKTRIEETKEALLETDSNGRFKTVRFADNSLTYSLNTETVTDEAAYQDAMNEYNYKVQQYEKTIADINAKTSIIQEEDRTLELRLKQLDTEQNALKMEMDAVKKVIKENVEKTFKTFSD